MKLVKREGVNKDIKMIDVHILCGGGAWWTSDDLDMVVQLCFGDGTVKSL